MWLQPNAKTVASHKPVNDLIMVASTFSIVCQFAQLIIPHMRHILKAEFNAMQKFKKCAS